MKKFLCLFLVLSMSLGLFAACGSDPATPETSVPVQTEATEGVKDTVNPYYTEDPAADDTINILMIGNSFCYYYADELVGMAAANGIKLRVSNVYYSGCSLTQHYTWWKNGERNYHFITHDANGRTEIEGADLEYCLKQGNWDMISLQQGGTDTTGGKTVEEALEQSRAIRTELWDYIKGRFPMSKYYWHHTWSYQIGYNRNGTQYTEVSQQHNRDQFMSTWAKRICNEDGLIRIPSGEAWRRVRDGGYDNLCARMAVNGGEGDYYHDGDVGGGQYLNACVWFERVLGQNCIGNTFRPDYSLSEDMIAMLQQAAHDTVALLKADEEGM